MSAFNLYDKDSSTFPFPGMRGYFESLRDETTADEESRRPNSVVNLMAYAYLHQGSSSPATPADVPKYVYDQIQNNQSYVQDLINAYGDGGTPVESLPGGTPTTNRQFLGKPITEYDGYNLVQLIRYALTDDFVRTELKKILTEETE